MKINIEVKGLDKLLRKAEQLPKSLVKELDDLLTEKTLDIVNDARDDAPHDTGALRSSIDILKDDPLDKEVGSPLDYAARQEYEHATRSGFLRNNINRAKDPLKQEVEKTIKKALQ